MRRDGQDDVGDLGDRRRADLEGDDERLREGGGGTGQAEVGRVDTTDDEYGDGTDCSLREAVRAANTNADYDGCSASGYGSDTIALGDGTYTLTLAGDDDSNAAGDLDTTGSLVIGITRAS